ncbi:MAG: DUF1566 domain-containing protein [Atribacterota bacterium]|nr:DUF1566 domain-containing protein [Atribacterota bacterium]
MYTTDSIFAKLVRFPATGQTTSYPNGNGTDIDDGHYQAGATLLYVNNGDGTITDSNTKLMWIKQPELIIPGASVIASNQVQVAHGNWVTSHAYVVGDLVSSAGGDAAPFYVCIVAHTSGTFATDLAAGKWVLTVWTASAANLTTPQSMVWDSTMGSPDALSACDNLTYAGYTDWRLPNVKELQSIVNYQNVGPAINTTYFPNAQSDYYWSSTTYAGYSVYAWLVYFNDGNVSFDYKFNPYQVRCVR